VPPVDVVSAARSESADLATSPAVPVLLLNSARGILSAGSSPSLGPAPARGRALSSPDTPPALHPPASLPDRSPAPQQPSPTIPARPAFSPHRELETRAGSAVRLTLPAPGRPRSLSNASAPPMLLAQRQSPAPRTPARRRGSLLSADDVFDDTLAELLGTRVPSPVPPLALLRAGDTLPEVASLSPAAGVPATVRAYSAVV
jgi:hypothetical protein